MPQMNFQKHTSSICFVLLLLFIQLSTQAFAGEASLSWDANAETDLSSYEVYFGTSPGNYGSPGSPVNVGNVTNHTISGLNDGTYYFALKALDSSGNKSGFSNEVSKTISTTDPTPPLISAISTSNISKDSVTISWTTDEAADSQIEYGTDTSYGSFSALNTNRVTSHSGTLTGLSSETLYHYRVLSRNAAGLLTTSANNEFTTLAGPDVTPPSISDITSENISTSSVTITWTTDEPATTQIKYGTTTSYGSTTTLNTSTVTSHSQNITGLSAGTLYHFSVLSMDAASPPNLATSGNNIFTTDTEPGDTSGPEISGIEVDNISASGVTITWTTDEDATSQVEYGTTSSYGTFSALNSTLVSSHSRSLSGLSASTLYNYRVISKDAADNTSISGNGTFTTTDGSSDTTGPVISNVTVQNITAGSASLNWTTDEPATSQVEFGLSDAYGTSTTKNETLRTNHQQIITGLSAGTSYHFRVKSGDASGNLSISIDKDFQSANAENTDISAPGDVETFTASGGQKEMVLSWTNPPDSDFAGVRIRFRTDNFPTNINDGELLGDISGDPGAAMQMTHSGLSENVTYYYLAASYDGSGNFQSPVFTSAKTEVPANTDDNAAASSGGGGCGMIRPGGGEPPKPGDAASMMTLMGAMLLMLFKKGLKTLETSTVSKWRQMKISI